MLLQSTQIPLNKKSQNWLKIAKYDLRAAESAFKNELYLKVYENSHSSLEKLLKAVISSNEQEVEKIHDLLRLASEAIVGNLQEDVKESLDELNSVYFSARYPEDFDMILDNFGKDRAEKILKEAKRIFTWLEKKIK